MVTETVANRQALVKVAHRSQTRVIHSSTVERSASLAKRGSAQAQKGDHVPERTVVVASKVGLHARPAAIFVKAAAEQPAQVMIRKGDAAPVDASSILAIMTLGVEHGDEVTLSADGDGADQALDALADLLARDLDAEGAQPPSQSS